MTGFLKILKIIGVVAGVVLVGVAVGWLGTRGGSGGGTQPNVAIAVPPLAAGANSLTATNKASGSAKTARRRLPSVTNTLTQATPGPGNLITNWEDRIDDILGAEGEEAEKANQMLAMFPRLPEDGQVEVAQHLSNLVSDEDYAPLGQYLTNSALPEAVLDVLLSDLLNRPNSTKLPLLLELAQNPQNPKSSEAKDLLELFLEEDYGTDWATWQAKMTEWLKENPD